MRKSFFIPLLTILLLQQVNAVPRSSVSLGTGGGGVASIEPGESSFMNPATIVHLKGRHFFSTFQKDVWAVSMTENDRETAIPGAFTYYKNTEYNQDAQVFGMNLADYAFQKFSVGATLNYWQVKLDGGEEKRKPTFNGSLGVAWTLNPSFGIAASFENVANRPEEFREIRIMGPQSRFGINYIFHEWFRTRLDFVTARNNNYETLSPQVGTETYLGKYFIARVGWNKLNQLRESWSAGLGLDMPKFRIDYASAWNVEGSKESRHSVDLAVPF